jgi:hypothetical protein
VYCLGCGSAVFALYRPDDLLEWAETKGRAGETKKWALASGVFGEDDIQNELVGNQAPPPAPSSKLGQGLTDLVFIRWP